MKVVRIDREGDNPRAYTGTVSLTHDEILMIARALNAAQRDKDPNTVNPLYRQLFNMWRDFEDMTCIGYFRHNKDDAE